MANQQQLFKLQPFTDVRSTQFPLEEDEDVLQLQADVLNVLEGRVDINTFPADCQNKIKDYWRFAAIRQNSKSNNVARRTGDTIDIV